MVDLYFLFIENTFGSFWVATFALAVLMLIIFMLGGVSMWTGLIYDMVFFLAMGIGWGTGIISISISIAILVWFFLEVKGFLDRGAGNF